MRPFKIKDQNNWQNSNFRAFSPCSPACLNSRNVKFCKIFWFFILNGLVFLKIPRLYQGYFFTWVHRFSNKMNFNDIFIVRRVMNQIGISLLWYRFCSYYCTTVIILFTFFFFCSKLMLKKMLPKILVFDLDGCVWWPEMYHLWGGGGSPFKNSSR